MPKKKERALSPRGVETIKERGMHCDGGGLYLQVKPSKDGKRINRSWIFRYTVAGRMRDMGLGPLSTIGLADARDKAKRMRAKLLDGVNPIDERKATRVKPADKSLTFDEATTQYLAQHEDTWKNAVHREQWRTSLRDYVAPVIGKLPVRDIETSHITKILDAIWKDKPETASRIRGRIESILDWAKVRGHRDGENPARWKGHLSNAYASPTASKKAKRARTGGSDHHSAMPYAEIGTFMTGLRQSLGTSVRALEFVVLTAVRSGEAVGARWDEFDLAAKVWTIPASRMKAGVAHRVPLSPRAMAILTEMAAIRESDFVFAGQSAGKPVDPTTLRKQMLARVGGHTVHGFRSSFRDWAAEQTNYPREICEAALAHVNSNKTEAAYLRTDLFNKRRQLMAAWSEFCGRDGSATGKVVPLHHAKKA
jgi:integrase